MDKDVEARIYATFAGVASSLGYSDVHGRIIAALISSKKPLALQDIAKKTGYSLAAVSLSLDLLGVLGIVKKMKNPKDRKLYAKIDGDIIEGMRSAFLTKIQLEIDSTLREFERYKGGKNNETIRLLEKEILRLKKYIEALAEIPVPK